MTNDATPQHLPIFPDQQHARRHMPARLSLYDEAKSPEATPADGFLTSPVTLATEVFHFGHVDLWLRTSASRHTGFMSSFGVKSGVKQAPDTAPSTTAITTYACR